MKYGLHACTSSYAVSIYILIGSTRKHFKMQEDKRLILKYRELYKHCAQIYLLCDPAFWNTPLA